MVAWIVSTNCMHSLIQHYLHHNNDCELFGTRTSYKTCYSNIFKTTSSRGYYISNNNLLQITSHDSRAGIVDFLIKR